MFSFISLRVRDKTHMNRYEQTDSLQDSRSSGYFYISRSVLNIILMTQYTSLKKYIKQLIRNIVLNFRSTFEASLSLKINYRGVFVRLFKNEMGTLIRTIKIEGRGSNFTAPNGGIIIVLTKMSFHSVGFSWSLCISFCNFSTQIRS